MQVKIKKLSNKAIMPKKATIGSAAYDLYVPKDVNVPVGRSIIPLDFALEMPINIEAKIEPRSGFSSKGMEGNICGHNGRFNCDVLVGKIDSDYRGNVGIILNNNDVTSFTISTGTKVAQMTFYELPVIDILEVDELSDTDRGKGGFGSTGK